MCFLLFQGFSALFRLFWPLKFPVAPNQHRPFCDLRQEPSNTGPPPLPGALPHTHSKTACRAPHRGASPEPAGETKSFCPCHKTGENTGFSPVFFFHVLHGFVVHFGSDTGFSHPVLPVPNCSHPLQHPKRTRFRFFGLNRVRFRIFCCFSDAKFSASFLFTLPT